MPVNVNSPAAKGLGAVVLVMRSHCTHASGLRAAHGKSQFYIGHVKPCCSVFPSVLESGAISRLASFRFRWACSRATFLAMFSRIYAILCRSIDLRTRVGHQSYQFRDKSPGSTPSTLLPESCH